MRHFRQILVCVATAASLISSPTFADDIADVRLPLGTVEMKKSFSSRELTLSTKTDSLTFESSYFPEVEAYSGNSFLIFLAAGDHDCGGFYVWATLDDAGLRASPPFGSCSDRGEVLRTRQGLMLVMPDPKSTRSMSFHLEIDGTVTKNEQGLKALGIVDPF